MAFLYGRARCLTAKNGGLRRGQSLDAVRALLLEKLCGACAFAPSGWDPMRTRFNRYDVDKDGRLGPPEVEQLLKCGSVI